MNSKTKIYIFNHILIRILCYIALLGIPGFIIALVYNFNVIALFAIIAISILMCLSCFWCNRFGVEILEDKIIFYNFRKHIFYYDKINNLEVEKHGFIQLEYNKKTYKFAGFVSPLTGWCNEEKNKDLVEEINKRMKSVRSCHYGAKVKNFR